MLKKLNKVATKNVMKGNLEECLSVLSKDVLIYNTSDINLDLQRMSNPEIKSSNFIWMVRQSGTQLIEFEKLLVTGTVDRLTFFYQFDKGLKFYFIKITDKGTNNLEGEVVELDKEKLLNFTKSNSEMKSRMKVKVKLKDGTEFEKTVSFYGKHLYINILKELDLCSDDIDEMYYVEYLD